MGGASCERSAPVRGAMWPVKWGVGRGACLAAKARGPGRLVKGAAAQVESCHPEKGAAAQVELRPPEKGQGGSGGKLPSRVSGFPG